MNRRKSAAERVSRRQVGSSQAQRRGAYFNLHVVCEGETEQRYVKDLVGQNPVLSENIVVKPVKAAGQDLGSLVKKAKQVEKQMLPSAPQAIWIVGDLDENTEAGRISVVNWLNGASRSCQRGIAFTNPCMEEWFLLHLVAHPRRHNLRNGYAKDLQKNLPGYRKGAKVSLPPELVKWEQAIKATRRAKQNLKAVGAGSLSGAELFGIVWENSNQSTFPELIEMLIEQVNRRTGKQRLSLEP